MSMANQPRYAIIEDGSTFHITWQCHNRDWLLKQDWTKKIYYDLLVKYKDRYKVSFYSYCFMDNHPHLTGYCENKRLLSNMFRTVNSLFAKSYNKFAKRRGQVVMDRFKSPRIQTDVDLLKVMQYIDLNPIRAGKVRHPKDYRWTSFHHYAYGKEDPLITPAPSYLSLGSTAKERQSIYLEMIENILKDDWKKKKPYSSIPFIGNPDWVITKTKQLREIQAEKRQKWRECFQKEFGDLRSG